VGPAGKANGRNNSSGRSGSQGKKFSVNGFQELLQVAMALRESELFIMVPR
jgi:hypothetical protein